MWNNICSKAPLHLSDSTTSRASISGVCSEQPLETGSGVQVERVALLPAARMLMRGEVLVPATGAGS